MKIAVRFWTFILMTLLGLACKQGEAPVENDAEPAVPVAQSTPDEAQQVVDRAIAAHGGAIFDRSYMSFVFRDRTYTRYMREGMYEYERIFTDPKDSSLHIRDVLSNEGFFREVNGEKVTLPEKDAKAYANSVNSVIYFAVLPYHLNDPAVFKKYLGTVSVKGQPYHKVEVRFQEEGGGKDHEDVFIYWFHEESHTMDYLAYLYFTDGGGIRFREGYHARDVGGIRFQDYRNYKMDQDLPLVHIDRLFEADSLEWLSDIVLENIQVEALREAGL